MNEIKVKSTVVFKWNYDAIHEKCPTCHGFGDHTCGWCNGSHRKNRYIINEGSSRSSKTRSIIQVYHDYASRNTGKRLSVWRDTKKLCKDTVLNDMVRVFPGLPFYDEISLHQTESTYTFHRTGSVIEIKGTDDPDQVHGYNGHVVWVNEPYSISQDTFDQLDQRTEDFVVIDWNPKIAHFVDKLKKNPRAIVIKSTFRNNPFCPPEQKTKILSYQPVKACQIVTNKLLNEREAKEYDIIGNPKGFDRKLIKELFRCMENERQGTANAFNWSVYGLGEKAEKPNRIFHWNEISDDDYHKIDAKKYYASDWGVVDPWAILESKYYDGALYFHERNYRSENQIRESLSPEQLVKIDQQDDGLVSWYFNQLNITKDSDILCDTNRPMKIIALRNAGYDNATTAPKPPGSIVDGINILNNLKVYFTASSANLKLEQENYEREVDRYGIVLETPVDKDNHLMDDARYIALFLQFRGIISKV